MISRRAAVTRQGFTTALSCRPAALAEAENRKRILVTQAQAEVDAAKLRAQAIAEVGAAAQKYPEYREQEFIGSFAEALHDGKISQIIYVPTERNIPIVEVPRAPRPKE